MIEAENLTITPDSPPLKLCLIASESGHGQVIARCSRCYIALWGHYTGAGPYIAWIRTGTLDKLSSTVEQSKTGEEVQSSGGQSSVESNGSIHQALRPDVYIFTKYKQSWVQFPHDESSKSFEEYYEKDHVWPESVHARYRASRERTQQWEARGARWEELGNVENQICVT